MNTTTADQNPEGQEAAQYSNKYPPQIKYIVWNEACERYSYYGMRSILVIFMVNYLLIAKSEATYVYHMFAGACYLFPVLGAFISDRFLGKYKTILYLSIVYCMGHLVLAIWETQLGLYWGLGLIALGSGGIKPCVSAHVGDQFNKSNSHLLKKVFDLFYWMINFGSFFSTMITPWVLEAYGPGWAFGIPGILMAIATLLFWMGRNQFVHIPPTGPNPHSALKVFFSALKNRKENRPFLDAALKDHPQDAIDGLRATLAVGKTFITVTIFWALFDQHGSSWILQAKQMDLNFMGIKLLPSQIPALNPIMVMALIPLFSTVLYPALTHRLRLKLTPLRKMGAGMFVSALSFFIVAILQYLLDSGIKLNVMWQFIPYLLITAAEVLISITGLEFAYTQAPRSMKSTIMSMWLLTVFFGNMITAYIAKINVFEGGNFFLFFTVLMLAVSFVFVMIAKNYKVRDYVES